MPHEFGIVNVAQVAGGIALFLYGLSLVSDNVRRYAGARLKLLLGLLTQNRWAALMAGAVIAAVMQSSSAATSLLVELTGGGLLSVGQALAVALGTGVGTSVTVQLISFRVESYALLGVAAGVLVHFAARRSELRAAGAVLMGFGLVFFGMHVMKLGFEPLRESQPFVDALGRVAATPLLGVLGAALLTAVVQASAATIAVAMGLTAAGVLPLSGAVAIVIGANVGTCATAFLPGARVGRRGLQVAVGNLALKLTGALVFLLIFRWAVVLAGRLGHDPARQIANFHTLFNIAVAVLLAPLAMLYARLASKLLPARDGAQRQRTASLVDAAAGLIDAPSRRAAERSIEQDDDIDAAVEILTIYLARIGTQVLSPREVSQRNSLLGILRALERIGDLMSKELAPAALQRIERGVAFSIEGSRQLRQWHGAVARALRDAVQCIDPACRSGRRATLSADEVEARTRRLYQAHYARVADGVSAAAATTSHFTDAVAALHQVHFQAGEIERLAAELNGGTEEKR